VTIASGLVLKISIILRTFLKFCSGVDGSAKMHESKFANACNYAHVLFITCPCGNFCIGFCEYAFCEYSICLLTVNVL
jgi:hypothetical protein